MHLVTAAELTGDRIEAKADRLAEEVAELIGLRRRWRRFDHRRDVRHDRYGGGCIFEHWFRGRVLAVVAISNFLTVRNSPNGLHSQSGPGVPARAPSAALGAA